MKKRWLGILAGLIVAIQLVPYGRNHTDPPVRAEPPWDRPETRALAGRACFNCHSNQTVWPWYSSIAPVSWLTQSDVDEGRGMLNFSEWDRTYKEAGKAPEVVRTGDMPPWYYTPMHSEAKLSATEREALAAGLKATLAAR